MQGAYSPSPATTGLSNIESMSQTGSFFFPPAVTCIQILADSKDEVKHSRIITDANPDYLTNLAVFESDNCDNL